MTTADPVRRKLAIPAWSVIVPEILWQSGIPTQGLIDALRPTWVVNLTHPFEPQSYVVSEATRVTRWPIDDGPLPDLRQLSRITRELAAGIQAQERILVHCAAGLNRSGLIVALALCKLGISPPQAIQILRAKRHPAVLRNRRFEAYVLTWQRVPPTEGV